MIRALRSDDFPAATADTLRLQRGAEHLHRLGPRATAEFIVQIVKERRDLTGTLALLDQWRARLSPEMVRLVGADRFACGIREVPRD